MRKPLARTPLGEKNPLQIGPEWKRISLNDHYLEKLFLYHYIHIHTCILFCDNSAVIILTYNLF